MGYSDLVADGYMARHDFNCAETMFNAANEHYAIGLDAHCLKAASGFGGGLGRELACGALTGGMMALGCLFARERSHRDPRMNEIRDRYVNAFAQHFGSTECCDIKRTHRHPELGCRPVVARAAKILEEIIESAQNETE